LTRFAAPAFAAKLATRDVLAASVAALESVPLVVPFDEETPLQLVL
jgi:bifunctional ADP-heptose synthase (sugar kinase/adenylyltransferase)